MRRAAAERLGSEIGIEDRGALPGNSHPERSEGSRYTPIVNHLSINTSRRGGAFLYSRRGLRLWRRGAYGIHRACWPSVPRVVQKGCIASLRGPPIGGQDRDGASYRCSAPYTLSRFAGLPLKGKRENRWHWILCHI